jgi:peptide/nickel transport system permease protein
MKSKAMNIDTGVTEPEANQILPKKSMAIRLRFLWNPSAMIGIVILFITIFIAIFGPLFAPFDPLAVDLQNRFLPPSATHLFGTDDMGRDIFSRSLHGIRISLVVSVAVLSFAVVFGIIFGATSGYLGGIVDNIFMRITDIFLAFPPFILAMAVAASLGPSLFNTMLAVMVVWWPWYARLVRGSFLSLKNNLYVEAARSIGTTNFSIIFRHILPNCIAPVLVMASLDLGYAILVTSSLSFIGLGARPPTPELGAMISQGRTYIIDYWWVPTFPGIVIFMMVLGVNLLGDTIRDFMDPSLRRLIK